ncbi:hypothetical protein CJ030_MR1G005066 [Morella rubra]|uniref:Uncharacterized protein n=1 Tax=Morella rubra TaxID=262757 RepID=A0A6A1WNQ6_9ROSI|nr:hypothetical protein CJ030_MR1G005066 [Morella rubra]
MGRTFSQIFTARGWMPILQMTQCVIHDMVQDFYVEMEKQEPTKNQVTLTVCRVRVTVSACTIAEFVGILRAAVSLEHDALPPSATGGTDGPPPLIEGDASPHLGVAEPTMDHILLTMTSCPGPYYRGGAIIQQKDLIPFFRILHLVLASNVDPKLHKADFTQELARVQGVPDENTIFQMRPIGWTTFLRSAGHVGHRAQPRAQDHDDANMEGVVLEAGEDHATHPECPQWADGFLAEITMQLAALSAFIEE